MWSCTHIRFGTTLVLLLRYWTGSVRRRRNLRPQFSSVMDDNGLEPAVAANYRDCDELRFVPQGFRHLNKEPWVVFKDRDDEGE